MKKFHVYSRVDLEMATDYGFPIKAVCGYEPPMERFTPQGWLEHEKKVREARTEGMRECKKCHTEESPALQTWAEMESTREYTYTWEQS